MTEQLTLSHERVADLPLLLAQLDRLPVAKLRDDCFPPPGNWEGLSLGPVVSVWLTCMLSEANHRMSHIEPWAAVRLQILSTGLGTPVRALDCSDERRAAARDSLSGSSPSFPVKARQQPRHFSGVGGRLWELKISLLVRQGVVAAGAPEFVVAQIH